MKRICKLCGTEFEPTNNTQRICKGVHYKPCPVCGKLIEWKGYIRCCSVECSKQKRASTNLDKYGKVYPAQNADIKQKCREAGFKSNLQRYGPSSTRRPPYGPAIGEGIYKALKAHSEYIRDFGPSLFRSILDALDVEYECNFKLSPDSPYVYDFKVGDVLVCIDDTISANKYARSSNYYHRDMTEFGVDSGYRVAHLFDWDNVTLFAMTLQRKETVYARNCIVTEIDSQTCDAFLRMYHLQGTVHGQKLRYGLYHNYDLVQVMTLGKSRYNRKYEYEILRMCSPPDTRVIGGASKLFNHFINQYDPESVVSYCDMSKFTGNVYTRIGMEYERSTPPGVIWSRGTDKMYDVVLNKVGYDNLFGATFGTEYNNAQLMQDSGWLPVYDCGQLVYTYKKERK